MSTYTVKQIAKERGAPCGGGHARLKLTQMYEAHPYFNTRYEALAKGF